MGLEFPALFDAHYEEIASYISRRQVDRVTAEDIAQMTFLEAYDRRATYDPERGSPRSWLYGIATHLMRRHFRSERRRLSAYGRERMRGLPPVDDCDHVDHRMDAAACSAAIAAALMMLSREEYEVLTLHCWADLSEREIAAALAIPRGTVKSRLHRARRKVREQLQSIQAEEPGWMS